MKVQDPDFLSWLFIPYRIFIKMQIIAEFYVKGTIVIC